MNAGDALRTALVLAQHGLDHDSASYAGVECPTSAHDRHVVRLALDAIQEQL